MAVIKFQCDLDFFYLTTINLPGVHSVVREKFGSRSVLQKRLA